MDQILNCDEINVQNAEETIKKRDFDFLFLYLNGLDDTGHSFSWCSSKYEEEIGTVDGYLGRILKALIDSGLKDETFIFLTSDHGGRPGAFDHGEQSDSNLNIPLIVNGPGFKKNYLINKTNLHNLDVAPTLLHAIGLIPHPLWRGRVIEEIFEYPIPSNGFLA